MDNWNLEEVYKSDSILENDITALEHEIIGYRDFKGKLNTAEGVESFFRFDETIDKKLSKIFSFVNMRFDLNQNNLTSQAFMSRIQNVFMTYSGEVSYVDDELLQNTMEDYKKWAKDNEYIKYNMYHLDKLFNSKTHVLKPELEKLLSLYQPVTSSFRTTYGLLENGDVKPVTVTLSDGTVTYTKNNYASLIMQHSSDQEDRKKIAEGYYQHYEDYKNTFASIYKGVVDSDIARMRARGYDNILDTFLGDNKIDKNVYLTLLKTVKENTSSLHRYFEYKRKKFNLKEFHTYDRFKTISESDAKYSFEFAKKEVLEALKPMGEDFVNHAKIALKDGHIDVYPKEGKRSGAYSTEIEGYGPYILLNHTDDLDSAFTIAHECGHSIHTLYASETQPFPTSNYVIFVAEIASTFNEQLFLDYLLSKSDDKAVKIQAIEKLMNNIVSTFYRQALFADFEYQAHELALKGNGLTYNDLNNIMASLYKEYYNIDLDHEQLTKYVWAYIPHLYNSPFYVYQYATCFSASFKIYDDVKNKKPHALEKYIDMLKAGGSDYPVEIVKKGGVDLTTAAPFKAVCDKLGELLDELEELVG